MRGTRGTRRWVAAVSLTRRYGIVSALVLTTVAIAVSQVLAGLIAGRAINQAEQTAVLAVGLGLVPHLEPDELTSPVPPATRAALDAALADSRSDFAVGSHDNRLLRVKVFGPDGTVVYSDLDELVGRTFRTGDLRDALGGRMVSKVTRLRDSDEQADALFGEALEVYVPLTFGADSPAGVAEVYLPYAPVHAAIQRDTWVLYGALAAGLMVFYLTLFQLVARASRRLRDQTSELAASAAQNQHLAHHDALTTLPNRTLLNDRLDLALAAARRSGGGLAVLLIDLDRFKEINDTLGHDTGDLLLCQVGERIHEALREIDTVARLGGDEFVVLLPDAGVEDAVTVAERLLVELHETFVVQGLDLAVEASIGVACHPEHGETSGDLLRHADVAMYAAKELRGTYAVYDVSADGSTTSRMILLNELRRALDEGQLVLHYQPKADVHDSSVRSVEALIRWEHPTRGLVGPLEFVPVAEQTGLIWPLTSFVITAALAQLREWLDSGRDLRVSVNLSARNLSDPELPARVAEMLDQAGVEAHRLDVEITESSAMVDPARASEVLRGLAALGVGVAVDDYGSGYSSLSYIRSLPVDTLKIDRSFVTSMLTDEGNAVIVKSTIELAHSLGLTTVAEGVEDAATYDALVELGCTVIQGYYLSRPIPAGDMGDFLDARAGAAVRST